MFVFQYICVVFEFGGNAKLDGFDSCLMWLVQFGLNIKGLVLCLQLKDFVTVSSFIDESEWTETDG